MMSVPVIEQFVPPPKNIVSGTELYEKISAQAEVTLSTPLVELAVESNGGIKYWGTEEMLATAAKIEEKMQKAEPILNAFGIVSNLGTRAEVFLSPDARQDQSGFYKGENAILVGTAGREIGEAEKVGCHESTHFRYNETVTSAGINHGELGYATANLFDEGIATLVHEWTEGNDARVLLQENMELIPEEILEQIENGIFANNMSPEEIHTEIYDSNSKANVVVLRYFPAALTAYCMEAEIKIQDIVEKLAEVGAEKMEALKQELSEKYNVEEYLVKDSIIDTAGAIKLKYPLDYEDEEAENGLKKDVGEIFGRWRVRPMEVIGRLTGKTADEVGADFVKWLEPKEVHEAVVA